MPFQWFIVLKNKKTTHVKKCVKRKHFGGGYFAKPLTHFFVAQACRNMIYHTRVAVHFALKFITFFFDFISHLPDDICFFKKWWQKNQIFAVIIMLSVTLSTGPDPELVVERGANPLEFGDNPIYFVHFREKNPWNWKKFSRTLDLMTAFFPSFIYKHLNTIYMF